MGLQVIANNDARLFILIEGVYRQIKTTELELSVSFSPTSFGINGEMFERNFVGQGTLEGSFKTPYIILDDESPDTVLVTKYLEKLATPTTQNQLNGHQIKVVNLNPDGSNKAYREIVFTAILSPTEVVESDLNDQAYLSFDIAHQSGYTVNYQTDTDDSVPKKAIINYENVELSGAANVSLKNLNLSLTSASGELKPINLDEDDVLVLRLKRTGNILKSIVVAKDAATANKITTTLGGSDKTNVIKTGEVSTFELGDFTITNRQEFFIEVLLFKGLTTPTDTNADLVDVSFTGFTSNIIYFNEV